MGSDARVCIQREEGKERRSGCFAAASTQRLKVQNDLIFARAWEWPQLAWEMWKEGGDIAHCGLCTITCDPAGTWKERVCCPGRRALFCFPLALGCCDLELLYSVITSTIISLSFSM